MELDNLITIINGQVYVREATKLGYAVANIGDSINLEQPNSKTRRGRVGKEIVNTLTCSCNQGVVINNSIKNNKNILNKECNYLKNSIKQSINKLKTLSLFSGIGAFEKSLENLGVDFELQNFCEIDKYAIQSYCAIHNVDEKLNLGDISQADLTQIKDLGLLVGGSPCQDFSVAGKQEGALWTCKDCGEQYNPIIQHYSDRGKCIKCNSVNLEKTRSSLLIEYLRAVRETKPKYIVYENVKNIVGKQFKNVFDVFIKELEEYGYNTHWKVLNSKDFGVAQNRERVFVVGIRKDIDSEKFEFPKGFELQTRLKDILEDKVDDKFYISEEKTNQLLKNIGGKIDLNKQVIGTCHERNDLSFATRDRVYNSEMESPTLTATMYKDAPKVLMSDKTVYEQRCDEGLRFFKGDYCGTIRTIDSGGDKRVIENDPFKIRKLTPKECLRLMSFSDEDYNKIKEIGISDTQIYRQAGNSIVVNVLYYIFKSLFESQNT